MPLKLNSTAAAYKKGQLEWAEPLFDVEGRKQRGHFDHIDWEQLQYWFNPDTPVLWIPIPAFPQITIELDRDACASLEAELADRTRN